MVEKIESAEILWWQFGQRREGPFSRGAMTRHRQTRWEETRQMIIIVKVSRAGGEREESERDGEIEC